MIRITETGRVRVVTLDRPARSNALRPRDLDALAAAVTEAETPVVYLCGAGGTFCAGADLDAVARLADPEAFARHGQRTMAAVENAGAVVVAGVDGAARGGGVELALACDVRAATPDATFAEPGVEFGLFGAWGGTVRLPRVVGEGDALDFSLSGRVLDAEAARDVGLVSRVTPNPRAVADELAGNDPAALRAVKRRVRDRRDTAVQEAAEAEAFGRLHREHADELAVGRRGRSESTPDERSGSDAA